MSRFLAFVPLAACVTSSGHPGGDPTAQDIEQYEELQHQLDAHRSEFLPTGIRAPGAAGHRLYWAEYGGGAMPPLASFDERTGARVTYKFSIGDATQSDVNYRASADAIVTTGESNVYTIYDATAQQQTIGQFSLTPPTGGVKWWAYAIDGTTVYVIVGTQLQRWQPGDAAPAPQFALEDAGLIVGELWDFDVTGNSAIVIESGAVWHVDLAAKTSVRVPAMYQLDPGQPISYDQHGVLYSTQHGELLYYSLASAALIDVSAAIAGNSYRINQTFASAHLYDSGGVLAGRRVIYVGNYGLFAYDLDADRITPILLAPHDEHLRIDYRAPTPLDSGTIYVVGLTSTDGAIGVEGPLYKVTP